jgi:hypothetical protein
VVSLKPQKLLPWSHWNRRSLFRSLIETAESENLGSLFCSNIETSEADNFKQFSPIAQQIQSHIQNGFSPWIRALGGIVWWKKLRVENLMAFRFNNRMPLNINVINLHLKCLYRVLVDARCLLYIIGNFMTRSRK